MEMASVVVRSDGRRVRDVDVFDVSFVLVIKF